MMAAAAALLVAIVASAAWLMAAFVFAWHADARRWATILLPAIVTMLGVSIYMGVWTPVDALTEEDVRWRVVLVSVSFMAGCFALLVTLPVWLMLENRLGAFARRP